MRSRRWSAATTWHNWAGNVSSTPSRVAVPGSADEVAAEVSRAAADGLTVRMAGGGHSSSPAATTDGVLLRPDRLTAIRSVDAGAGTVTVEAGCTLHVLNAELLARGLALAAMGAIQAPTVAGATQTGTHGTGRDVAGLAAQIAGAEVVLADGRIVSCSPGQPGGGLTDAGGAPLSLFDAVRVGLGALGVVTAITFEVVPAFLLTAREEPMSWSAVRSRLDELTAENEHFEFCWFPHTEDCLVRRSNRAPAGAIEPPRPASAAWAAWQARPLPRWRYLLEDEFLANSVFGLACGVGRIAPGAIPAINSAAARARGTRTYTDVAHRVLTRPRRVRFKQQEYAIPRAALSDVLAEVRALFRRGNYQVSFPVEIRVSPPDDVWLSAAYGRDTAYVAAAVFRSAPHERYFADVEAIMTSVGGRPHWGMLHTRDADYLAGCYPRMTAFLAIRDRLDPDRRFANPYLDQVLGA